MHKSPSLEIWNRKPALWRWCAKNGPPNREDGFFACTRDGSQHPIVSNGAIAVEIPLHEFPACERISKSSIVFADGNGAGNHLYTFIEKLEDDLIILRRTSILIETKLDSLCRVYTPVGKTSYVLDDVVCYREKFLQFIGDPLELCLVDKSAGIAVTREDEKGFHAWIADVAKLKLPSVLYVVVSNEEKIIEQVGGVEEVPQMLNMDALADMLRD